MTIGATLGLEEALGTALETLGTALEETGRLSTSAIVGPNTTTPTLNAAAINPSITNRLTPSPRGAEAALDTAGLTADCIPDDVASQAAEVSIIVSENVSLFFGVIPDDATATTGTSVFVTSSIGPPGTDSSMIVIRASPCVLKLGFKKALTFR